MGKDDKKKDDQTKWTKEDFIKAWIVHQGTPGDGNYSKDPKEAWSRFFAEMSGCAKDDTATDKEAGIILEEKDLALRLGITARYMKKDGWAPIEYPRRPKKTVVDDESINEIMKRLAAENTEGVKKA